MHYKNGDIELVRIDDVSDKITAVHRCLGNVSDTYYLDLYTLQIFIHITNVCFWIFVLFSVQPPSEPSPTAFLRCKMYKTFRSLNVRVYKWFECYPYMST